MSRYVHGSGRDDAQLNNCPQGRFPKILGLGAAGFSPPTVQLVSRVATMAGQAAGAPYYLTGGLCENAYVVERLGALLGSPVETAPWHALPVPSVRPFAHRRSRRGLAINRPLSAPPCVYWEELIDL